MERYAAAVLRDNGKIFLWTETRSSYPNVWDLPGGHLEPGEIASEAIVRELQGELGILVGEPQEEPWETLRIPGIEMSVFLIEEWVGVPISAAPEEHDRLGWFAEKRSNHWLLLIPRTPICCTDCSTPRPRVHNGCEVKWSLQRFGEFV